jgi:hypothetical protein
MEGMTLPAWMIDAMMSLNNVIKQGWAVETSTGVKDVTGHEVADERAQASILRDPQASLELREAAQALLRITSWINSCEEWRVSHERYYLSGLWRQRSRIH